MGVDRMLNAIWLGMILLGIAVAAMNGRIEVVTEATLSSARQAVEVCFELVGIMAFWLGLLKIAEKAGLVQFLAKLVRPFMVWLFPSVPADHPAMGAMIMNITANILGLGNAATPFGLKAMQELQVLNRHSEEASDAMCTFLALNTSCLTLLPATIIGVRAAAGSIAPTQIVGTTIFATTCSMMVAIIADYIFRQLHRVIRSGR